jgi:putative ATPase
MAFNEVKAFVAEGDNSDVPVHLRNAPTKLMKELDYGKNYRYAHNEPDAYAAGEKYFPDNLDPIEFYKPTTRGLEGKILEKMNYLKSQDKQKK